MSEKKDGGPAFPSQQLSHYEAHSDGFHSSAVPVYLQSPGMTLRDYFAGQALMGLYASSVLKTDIGIDETAMRARAKLVLAQADAMISEREK